MVNFGATSELSERPGDAVLNGRYVVPARPQANGEGPGSEGRAVATATATATAAFGIPEGVKISTTDVVVSR